MRKLTKLFIVLLGVGLSCFVYAAEEKSLNQKADVRLLIDISGSMKKNDPNNLRIPALQLVTNLMPKGADAGVWAFGRYVNMIVPLATVDSSWQDRATKAATKINSAGLFTNIGGVLESASYGWNSAKSSHKRSIILLTDGMVDISKDPKINAAERKKILEKILPKLVSSKVTLHTIALSQNADHELLKKLSNATDGWYQAVDSPEALQKVFLKIFEQSAARDSLPLTDNHFKVDKSIEEMTLLVFKQNVTDTTRLISPDKTAVTEAAADGSVRWFNTSSYDLITVKNPKEGDWQIDANVDPDNRVMVVSNLSLNVAEIPNNLLAGEAINYEVGLLEENELIKNSDFLKLVEARLIQDKQGQTSRLAMFFDKENHQFKQNFFTDSYEGVLNLMLEVKSPTFERTRNHAVNIYGSPLEHKIELSTDEAIPHKLSFKIRQDIVQSDSLKASATINYPDGEKQYLSLDDLTQTVALKVFPAGGDYTVVLDIKGQSILGRNFSVSPSPIIVSSLPTADHLASLQVNEKPEVELVIEEAKKEQDKTAVENAEETDWTLWLIIGLVVNLVLVGLGIVGWKIIRSKSARRNAQLSEELLIDEDDDDETGENKVAEEKE